MELLLALMVLCIGHQSTHAFKLPDFSWDVVPRFVHCGPDFKPNIPGHPPRLPLSEIYRRMSIFPMATLEKFTLQTAQPANLNEEAKIIEAARAIKSYNTSTRVMFYQMAWQNFPQYDLYNETLLHVREHWTITWDNGTIPGYDDWGCREEGRCRLGSYNLSNPYMRAAWVAGMSRAMATGAIDGFFIDITPQALPNRTDPSDPIDPPTPYALNIAEICSFCSEKRRSALLEGLRLALRELAKACPDAIIICNPTDMGACNTEFFEYFGTSVDHGRSVLGDFYIMQNKFNQTGHVVQARAAAHNSSFVFHLAEFLVGAGDYSYLGISHGWGCDDGWLEDGVPGDPLIWTRPLGRPLGPMRREAGPNGSYVYTRSFAAGTHVWLNLTDGDLWKHARACVRPDKPWPSVPVCPQLCIWWGDGHVTSWPPGYVCKNVSLVMT